MGLLGGIVGGLAGFALGGPAGALSGASAGLSYGASKDAAKAQEEAAQQAAAVQKYMYDTSREDMAPWRQVGVSAINQMRDLQGLGEEGARETAINQFYRDPGYQFRLDEGRRAVENSMLARGQGLSGNTARALTEYGQGMGSQEYGNYYNRLAGLSGTGQTATNQLSALGANAATGIGNANLAAGQARGSGYIGMADSLANATTGIAGALGYGGTGGWGSNWGNQSWTPSANVGPYGVPATSNNWANFIV